MGKQLPLVFVFHSQSYWT